MTESKEPKTRLGQLMAMMLGGMGTAQLGNKRRAPLKDIPRKERACIVCGNNHTGNNAFCSAECCKEHKANK